MTVSGLIRSTVDRFMGGRGEFSITVPVMDGALKPNDYLERAGSIALIEAADNIVAVDGTVLASSGNRILQLTQTGEPALHSEHEAPISCLAVSGAGAIAIGLDGVGVRIVGGRHDGKCFERLERGALQCPTAALFLDEGTLIVSNGSAVFSAADWRHDLLHKGRSGTVTRLDLAKGTATDIANGLGFPAGLAVGAGEGREIFVCEAWRHRLVALLADERPFMREVLAGLPAYPGRMCASASGGYWLAFFAVRSQLQEFVLREDRFRRQMIAEVEPEFWIAPALSSGRSFKEPLQAGGVIRLGIHKPWAPTRSYGLVARLDAALTPLWSGHSRADGKRHGITSLAEVGGRLLATSKGKGEVIAIRHTAPSEPNDLAITAGDET